MLKRFASLYKGCCLLVLLLLSFPALAWKMESGTLDLPSTTNVNQLHSFSFQQVYDTPPIVVALATDDGGDASALRINSITTTGFRIAQVEPNSQDGPHASMTVSYFAIEPGTHTLPDGNTIEAGTFSSEKTTGGGGDFVQFNGIPAGQKDWFQLDFNSTFNNPVLLAAIQTTNSEPAINPDNSSHPWLTVAVDNITNTQADIALERSEEYDSTSGPNFRFNDLPASEFIGYVVMDSGLTSNFRIIGNQSIQYETHYQANAVDGWDDGCDDINFSGSFSATPVVLATKSSHDIDGGWLRECSKNSTRIQLTIDEDRRQDNERSQAAQDVSVLAFSSNFIYDSNAAAPATSDVLMMEADSVVIAADSFTYVPFKQAYDLAPAVFILDDDNNPEPSNARIRNVTTTGFEVVPTEPDSGIADALDLDTTIHYLAITYGDFQLSDGTPIEIGQLPLSNFQSKNLNGRSWLRFNYNHNFSSTPALLSQIQTMENEPGHTPGDASVPWMTVTLDDADSSGADIALERAEVRTGSITQTETVAYLAIEPGILPNMMSVSGEVILSEAIRSSDSIRGTRNCDTINFAQTYPAEPLVVGTQNTRDGGDGGWLRRCTTSSTNATLKIEEDYASDRDRSHTSERAGLMVFSGPFAADMSLQANYQLEGPSWNGLIGEVKDSSGNDLNGITVGNTTAEPAQVCYGASFSGTVDAITVPDNDALDIVEELTVMAWINADAIPTSGLMTIVSKDTNYEFHVNTSGQIFWWWENGSTSRSFDSGAFSITPGTWHHVAIVYSHDEGAQRIYVDGMEQAAQNYANETMVTNALPLHIGIDYNSPTRAFAGQIDEVKVFSRALSSDAIQLYSNESRACNSCVLGSFDISQPNYALACPDTRATIDITARCIGGDVKTDYLGTVSLSGPAGSQFYAAANGGTAINGLTFTTGEQGVTQAYLYYDNEDSDVRVTVEDNSASVSDTATSGTDFRAYGFRVSQQPTDFACGDSTALRLSAYGRTDNTPGGSCAVITGFSGTKNLDAWFSATTDDDGTQNIVTSPLRLNGTSVTNQNSSADSNLSLEFTAGEATINLAYENAAHFLDLNFRHDDAPYDGSEFSELTASSQSFTAYPDHFELSAERGITALNNSSNGGAPTHAAGEAFTLSATAQCSNNAIASDYQPTANSDRVMAYLQRTGPTGGSSVDGILRLSSAKAITSNTAATPSWESANISSSSFSNGVYQYGSANYSEVGLIHLYMQDQNYFGNTVSASSLAIGRFIPDHFGLTLNDGALAAYCSPAAGNDFSYIGQALGYATAPSLTLTAQNASNATTQNYTESGYLKLTPADITRVFPSEDTTTLGADAATAMAISSSVNQPMSFININAGNLEYQFDSNDAYTYDKNANALVAPFISEFDINITAISDQDAVTAAAFPYTLSPTGINLKYGRWAMDNSFGPEIQSQLVPMRIEHWNGNRFVTNTDDSCTSYAAANLSHTDSLNGGSTTPSTPAGATTILVDGEAASGSQIQLSAPGAGHTGTSDLEYLGDSWLRFDWDNNPATADTNATATATFGQYRGHDRIIYWRELTN